MKDRDKNTVAPSLRSMVVQLLHALLSCLAEQNSYSNWINNTQIALGNMGGWMMQREYEQWKQH